MSVIVILAVFLVLSVATNIALAFRVAVLRNNLSLFKVRLDAIEKRLVPSQPKGTVEHEQKN